MRSLATHMLVLLTTCASVFSSPFTVSLKRIQRTATYPGEKGNHARSITSRAAGKLSTTVPAINQAAYYSATVGVGEPVTNYTLVVDTGSSNTFVGVMTAYNRTSTSIPTGQRVSVTYGSGSFSGVEYLDQVTLAPNLVITNQSIGDALTSEGFEDVDGIMGVGPADRTVGTLSPDVDATVPTIVDNLKSQGLIDSNILSVSFAPLENDSDTNGFMTLGGVDGSLFIGNVSYVPVTATPPAASFWGINVTSVTYGENHVIPSSTAGIVDTGTTLVGFAEDFFDAYMKAIPGSFLNTTTGLLEVPEASIPAMRPLNFNIGDKTFIFDAAAQLLPPSQNVAWGGDSENIFSTIYNMGRHSGQGLDFILGLAFMERYYTVFDAEANRVGFAETEYTFSG